MLTAPRPIAGDLHNAHPEFDLVGRHTRSATRTDSLRPLTTGDIIARTRYLLLDFDGPICDIFAGHPDITVASSLRKLITSQGITMPSRINQTRDPFEVFTYSATISTDLAAQVEAVMTEQELAAVPTAKPTAHVHDVVTGCRDSGRTVAVVSNNSDRAVRAYLATHGLDDRVDLVVARTSPDPALLKPSPHLIEQAMNELGAPIAEVVLVGDSTTDIQAGRSVGVSTIGYANKSGKSERLTTAGATAVVGSLADLVLPLRARRQARPDF
jgi:phosphoglycolate phosphatase